MWGRPGPADREMLCALVQRRSAFLTEGLSFAQISDEMSPKVYASHNLLKYAFKINISFAMNMKSGEQAYKD